MKTDAELTVIAHNIRSAYNVGAIFRTADGAGVNHVYLTGYTPSPVDRFGRAQKEISKTALGAEKTLSWSHHVQLMPLLCRLRRDDVNVIALEQSPAAVHYNKCTLHKPTAVLIGNEVRGLSKRTLGACNTIAEIPMRGEKESLNVAVALGIFLFTLRGGE